MTGSRKRAIELHERIPPDWYARSIRENIFQRFWHNKRFVEVGELIEDSSVYGGKILDIGCADGTFTKVILDRSHADEIIGVDILKESIFFAKKRFARNKKMSFRVADAHKLPFGKVSFDGVFCLEALEHVLDPLKVLREIYRVLKKNGYVVILVPSENIIFRIIWWFWQKGRGKIWKHTHLHNYSGSFLGELLEKSGFKVTEDKKFLFNMLHVVKAEK